MQRCPLPDRILQLDPGKGKDKRIKAPRTRSKLELKLKTAVS